MKKIGLFSILILWVAGILSDGSLAQDEVEWHFTEGAKMRLGKGSVNDIQFSPDGTQFAVATSIGIWIYDAKTGAEITFYHWVHGSARAASRSVMETSIAQSRPLIHQNDQRLLRLGFPCDESHDYEPDLHVRQLLL